MRHFLAMAFPAVALAFGASPALAYGDKVDYVPSHPTAQRVTVVSGDAIRSGSPRSIIAGGGTATATLVYRQLREDNREH